MKVSSMVANYFQALSLTDPRSEAQKEKFEFTNGIGSLLARNSATCQSEHAVI